MEDVKEPWFSRTVSHFDILRDFDALRGNFKRFPHAYSKVEQVTISEANGLTEHQLWAIVHCKTKITKNVKRVEVSESQSVFLENPYELLEEYGFHKEIPKETKRGSANFSRANPFAVLEECGCHKELRKETERSSANRMKKTATPKATVPGKAVHSTRLIISLNEMKDMVRRKYQPPNANHIKEIKIFHFDNDVDKEFQQFLARYHHLETLQLSGNGQVKDSHLKAVSDNLHQLRYLYIYMKGSISDEGICFLTGDGGKARCPLLAILKIVERQNITKRSIERIKNKLREVSYLDLWLDEVDDDVVEYISNMWRLETVQFRCHKRIKIPEPQQRLMTDANFTMDLVDGRRSGGSQGIYSVSWTRSLPSEATTV